MRRLTQGRPEFRVDPGRRTAHPRACKPRSAVLTQSDNIILVGFMGAGKSAVGRRLSRELGRPFFDTDRWIAERAGCSIPEIFARYGESAFRDLESEAAAEVARCRGLVVSTGGGILGRAANVALLRSSGVLVFLAARPDVILARTAPWDTRPLLRDAADPRAEVERLLRERQPAYDAADLTVDTSERSIAEVADEICAKLPSHCLKGAAL